MVMDLRAGMRGLKYWTQKKREDCLRRLANGGRTNLHGISRSQDGKGRILSIQK